MSKKPPCKDCERSGCGSYHDECEKYLKWKKENQRVKRESGCRDYIKETSFKHRTHGAFKCSKK